MSKYWLGFGLLLVVIALVISRATAPVYVPPPPPPPIEFNASNKAITEKWLRTFQSRLLDARENPARYDETARVIEEEVNEFGVKQVEWQFEVTELGRSISGKYYARVNANGTEQKEPYLYVPEQIDESTYKQLTKGSKVLIAAEITLFRAKEHDLMNYRLENLKFKGVLP